MNFFILLPHFLPLFTWIVYARLQITYKKFCVCNLFVCFFCFCSRFPLSQPHDVLFVVIKCLKLFLFSQRDLFFIACVIVFTWAVKCKFSMLNISIWTSIWICVHYSLDAFIYYCCIEEEWKKNSIVNTNSVHSQFKIYFYVI